MDEETLLRHCLWSCHSGFILLLPPWGTYQCFPFTYLLGNQPAGGDRDSLFLCDPLLDSTSSHYNSPVNNNPYLRVLEKDQYPYQNIRMARCLYPLVLCYLLYWASLVAQTGLEYEYASDLPHSGGFYMPFYRLLHAWKGVSLERDAFLKLEQNSALISVDSCSFRSPDIILIIGEAYSKHHSQLYGYEKATTPRQMQMMCDSSLVAFTDVVSPYHQTSMVFRLTFSLYAYGQQGDWTDYPLFPQLFQKAGYQVSFLTNQFVPSPTLDVFDFSGSAFVNNPKISPSMFTHRNQHSHPYDIGLLEDYDSLAFYRQEHNLTIFHLLGQHTAYADRYPEMYDLFKPQDYQRSELSEEDISELAHYDNACLYNDYVVTEITRHFMHHDAIVIYMPDHGEMCYDGSLTFGRTLEVNTPNEIYQQFEIPFWIWTSPIFRKNHPDIVQQIIKAKDRPFMTDNISQLLLYLADISTPYYREEDNLISPCYNTGRKRMLMGTIPYDEYLHKK